MADENVKESPKSEEKEPELLGMLLRDAAVVFAGLALWGGADAWATTSGLAVALVTSVGSALIAGWIIASLMHEWGHYLGAKLIRIESAQNQGAGPVVLSLQLRSREQQPRSVHINECGR